MKEIKLTQGQVALVDDVDYEYLMQWKWYADCWDSKNFRVKRKLPRVNGKQKNICIHTVIAERMGIDSKRIDHEDRNPLNNCRSNLRAATVSQNGQNRGVQLNSITGVKGVWFDKQKGRYTARITIEGKRHYFGLFDTIPEAEAIIKRKREELVGEFACH